MEDRRAHERIDGLEETVKKHLDEHDKFEKAMEEHTRLIKQLVENTDEIVQLVKGAKGFRNFFVWIAPVIAGCYALYHWIASK